MIKRYLLAGAFFAVLSAAVLADGPIYWWVTLYDGGKPVQVWVARAEPKVSGDTCRFIPQGQKNETVIHGVFSVSTQPPPAMPDRPVNSKGF